jgi:hypothetical protein
MTMKKAITILGLAVAVLATLGCEKEETTCTMKVYRQINGSKYELIQNASWTGEKQYKNYVKTYRDNAGNIINTKTIVTCD